MLIVPLQPVPSQVLGVQLNAQNCNLAIYQKAYGLFMDVSVDETLIIGGVICQNLNRIVRSLYLGFEGDFVFIDSQGNADPFYTGLGARFSLAYLEPSDLPPGQG